MQTFFQDNQSDELILLFCGWGMDEKSFLPIKSWRDVLFVYDYVEIEEFAIKNNGGFPLAKIYAKITLITFSAGVFAAAYLKDILPKCDLKIAVNGVLNPIGENIGISKDVLSQMETLTMDTVFEFRKKLINNPAHLDIFNENQPTRDLVSSLNELAALKKYFTNSKVDLDFDRIIIGKYDEIIPPENQLAAWLGHENITVIQGGHFLFYMFENYDELIALSS